MIVAVTGLWPETQLAIFALLAFAGVFVLVVHDLLPPRSLGTAKFVVEGSVAITFATLLVLLTGAENSPFFFTFPLIVGGAALVVSPAGHVRARRGREPRLHLRDRGAGLRRRSTPVTVAKVGINLTALVLLAYVATVIAREQRVARDAADPPLDGRSADGLFNRTFFFAAVEREIARSLRSARGFCLLMMDLDELKLINDRYGHFFGDQVLRGVGEVIQSGVRQDRHRGPLRRRRVRRAAARRPIRPARASSPRRSGSASRSSTIPVAGARDPASISVGVVNFPDDGQTTDELMISADQAMYARSAPARTGSWASRSTIGGGADERGVASGHAGTGIARHARPPRRATRPRPIPSAAASRPGRSGPPTACRSSTSGRRRSRSTRPSRSRAATPRSSARS